MTTDWFLSPGLVMIAMAFFVPVLKRNGKTILLFAPLVSLLMVWTAPELSAPVSFMGYELRTIQSTGLGRLFATTFALVAWGGLLFAWKQASKVELAAALLYAGSAVSAVLSGDFITFFIFWELMAIGSTLIIFSAGTRASAQAGMRYALIHLLSGMILFSGIAGLIAQSGDVSLRLLDLSSAYEWMILFGFLINAGAPPLSAWVADAYPEASASGTVFLSVFTTKTAVFALLAVFAGTTILIPIGIYMIFYGIIYAVLESDMRRILSYSIVNQVGFMIAGIGIGGALAVSGVAAHASVHIVYKALLMMSAGSVLYATGQRKCSELGGLYRVMRLTRICGVVGAVSISAAPWTSGFVSKSLISEAAYSADMIWLWIAFTVASAGVFLHAGIFSWFVFFQDKAQRKGVARVPTNMQAAMVVFSIVCLGVGIFPQLFYQLLPYPIDYQPYTVAHVVSQTELLLFSMIAFFLLLPLLKRTLTITLDFDWFYRRLPHLLSDAVAPQYVRNYNAIRRVRAQLTSLLHDKVYTVLYWAGRDISTTSLIAALVLVLSVLLLLYY